MEQLICGAMESEGKTIAVLGCGPDYIYPAENKGIYKKIIEKDGLIVSEYPKGTKTQPERFRQRNRIVSGLSLGILVVEAGNKSGTGITARYAKEQGKDVFCIPNSIDNIKGIGTNNLIKKGAILVLSPNEILEKYGIDNIEQIEKLKQSKNISLFELNNIKEEYKEIYKILSEPLNAEEISAKTGIKITEIYSKIFMMEMEGLIEYKGNKYKIKEI